MAVRKRQARSARAFLAPFLVLFAVTFLLPIGYAIYESLQKTEASGLLGLGGNRTVFAGIANYSRALQDAAFLASIRRVLLFAVVVVPVMIIMAVGLALLLDAASARWTRFFRATYFMPYGVPGVIASILWGFLYTPGTSPILDGLGHFGVHADLLGGSTVLWSIANIVIWEFAGYNVLVITAQIQAIPSELYEAARIDGATSWQIARHVKLPLLRPAIVMTTVFTIIGTLQLFAEPLILKPVSRSISYTYTPNLAAYNSAFSNNDYHLAAAQAVLLAVAAFVLSFGFLRVVGRRGGRR